MSPYTGSEARKREILRQARANVAGHTSTASRPLTTPHYTEERKREILREARANVAGHRPSNRSDQARFGLLHKTYEPKDDDELDDQSTAGREVTVREVTPVATASAQQPWWEWADQKIDAAISVEHEFVMEIMGGALGECMRNLREPLEREDSALKREVKLLRRELATLREELRVRARAARLALALGAGHQCPEARTRVAAT